jgi:hypothetical protein
VLTTIFCLLYLVPIFMAIQLNPSRRATADEPPVALQPRDAQLIGRLKVWIQLAGILCIVVASRGLFGEAGILGPRFQYLVDFSYGFSWLGLCQYDKAKSAFYDESGIFVTFPSRTTFSAKAGAVFKKSRHWPSARRGLVLIVFALMAPLVYLLILFSAK